jgi:hypothetical protein
MGIITLGQVKNGVIVPNIPLPERAWCRIEVQGVPPEMPPELEEELKGWQMASAKALKRVERLAEEMEADEKE